MSALDATKFNNFLFRRVPDWDAVLAQDRFPKDYSYQGLYPTKPWPSFTGTVHTWDRVHVTVPNDDADWEAYTVEDDSNSGVTNGPCAATVNAYCDPARKFTGWGSTRSTYYTYHQDYMSPVFCFDQLRHVEEAIQQLDVIVAGHKKLPNEIISTFLRKQSLWKSDTVYICGSGLKWLSGNTGATAAFPTFPTTRRIALGSANYLPTSKLTMQYLNHYFPALMYKGYHDQQFIPEAKFEVMTDIQAAQELCNANPALAGMYNSADFTKGGKFYQFGAMMGCGNALFHVDTTPLRFYHIGGGILQEVVPFQNVAATTGKKPQFDPYYEAAPYQIYHVYSRACREIHVGDITSVNGEMKFGLARSLNGKWSWKSPDYFKALDPLSGEVKEYNNDKHNKGYFLGEFEMGIKTIYPEIEMMILALREPQAVADVPRAADVVWPDAQTASTAGTIYQQTLPYQGSPGYMCLD